MPLAPKVLVAPKAGVAGFAPNKLVVVVVGAPNSPPPVATAGVAPKIDVAV